MASNFIGFHLSSAETWFPWSHTWPYHRLQLYHLKSQPQISRYLSLPYFHIPCFLTPMKPLALTWGDLNLLDLSSLSYSPQGLFIFVLVLPKLDLNVWQWNYSLTSTFNSLTSLLCLFSMVLVLIPQKWPVRSWVPALYSGGDSGKREGMGKWDREGKEATAWRVTAVGN